MSKKAVFWTLAALLMIGAVIYLFMRKKPGKPAKNKPAPPSDTPEPQPNGGGSAPAPGSGFQEDCVTVPAGMTYDPAQNGGLPPCYNSNDPNSPPLNTDARFPKS